MGLVAGVDSSTQSCTVALHDADSGVLVSLATAPHALTVPPVSEQDPRTWWNALAEALARACDLAGCDPSAISAISVAAQHHGLVPLDADGVVIRPAKLWNDTTSAPQAERLVRLIGAEHWVRRTGSVPTAAFTVTKLAWLAEHEPENFERMAMALLPHDWLTLQLVGAAVTDRGDASGTGYFDSVANTWCEDLLAYVDPGRNWISHLPRVLGPETAAGLASTDRARELGLAPDTIVGPGTGDQSAAALGLGIEEGDQLISLGTSGVVTGLSSHQITSLRGLVNGTANASGSFQPVVITLNAAKVTDTFARLLGVDLEVFSNLALAADRHARDRPVMAAYLDGERTPNRPYARGLLAGLSTASTREELALCAVESVLLGLLQGRQAMAEAGMSVRGALLLTGGASRSPAYRQILASLSGRSVYVPHVDGGAASARGAAVQAAAVLLGHTARQVASEWAPELELVAEPRPHDGEYARERELRYREVTAIDQLDQPPRTGSEPRYGTEEGS